MLSNLFIKKDTNTITLDGFYNLDEDTQEVMFFGSSHIYCAIVPNLLVEEHGIESYVLGTTEQPIQASYFLMVESLKTQIPDIIVLETFMINRSQNILKSPDKSARIHNATDSMKFSRNRYKAVEELTTFKMNNLHYHINFLEYHNRWSGLTDEDFEYETNNVENHSRGYFYIESSTQVHRNINKDSKIAPVDIDESELNYLRKIVELAEDNNIELILMSTPYMISEYESGVLLSLSDFAEGNNLSFYNSNEIFDTYNFNLETDFYNEGHLNYSGAVKYTRQFGLYLEQIMDKS